MFQLARSWQYGLDQGLYSEGKNYPWFSNGSSNAFINHVIGRYYIEVLNDILNCQFIACLYILKVA